jgi:hypothetical protein
MLATRQEATQAVIGMALGYFFTFFGWQSFFFFTATTPHSLQR